MRKSDANRRIDLHEHYTLFKKKSQDSALLFDTSAILSTLPTNFKAQFLTSPDIEKKQHLPFVYYAEYAYIFSSAVCQTVYALQYLCTLILSVYIKMNFRLSGEYRRERQTGYSPAEIGSSL